MIWIYIFTAIFIAVFLLRRDKISFENYIWLLLPVDMYGIHIGVNVKLYMLFSVFLLIKILRYRSSIYIGSSWFKFMPFIILLALLVNLFNGGDFDSIRAIMMVAIAYFAALIYASCIKRNYVQIPKVIVAGSIGYGAVFMLLYVMWSFGIRLDDLVSYDRMLPGIFMYFSNAFSEEMVSNYRLRGFFIDPNVAIGPFISAIVIDLFAIFNRKHSFVHYLSMILSACCIALTGSRMALICSFIIMVLFIARNYNNLNVKYKNYIKLICMGDLPVSLVMSFMSGALNRFVEGIIVSYSSRAGLYDEFGRFTIWREMCSIWFDEGLFWGMGYGKVKDFTTLGLECHNSWLEWLCGCGLLVGGLVVLYFLGVIITGIRKKCQLDFDNNIVFQSLLFGFISMAMVLSSVSNITNSYFWFYMIAFQRILDTYCGAVQCES